MVLKKNSILRYALIILLHILGVNSISFASVLKLLTKQTTRNVRFFSNDHKFSYSQTRSGLLIFSTNYKIHTLLKGPPGTNYTVVGSDSRKKIAIVKNDHFHTFLSVRDLSEIYVTDWASKEKPVLIGMGTDPILHEDDSLISYYNLFNKTIYFRNIRNMIFKFKLKIANKVAPYFIPSIVILDNGSIMYTDINDEGITGIMIWERGPNTFKNLWKATTINDRIEICRNKEEIFILKKTVQNISRTTIIKLQAPFKDIKKSEVVYKSDSADIGNMICNIDQKIYFIKETVPGRHEVVCLNLIDKKISILTQFKSATQIINVDGTLIAPYNGENYVLFGKNDFKKDTLRNK